MVGKCGHGWLTCDPNLLWLFVIPLWVICMPLLHVLRHTIVWEVLDPEKWPRSPSDTHAPLDVVIERQGDTIIFWSESNRRLVAMLAYQSTPRDTTVWVRCFLRPPDDKFYRRMDTRTDGLSIRPVPLWDHGAATLQQAHEVVAKPHGAIELHNLTLLVIDEFARWADKAGQEVDW